MNNYLQGLPFNAGQGKSSDCDCPGQAFDPAKFKLYSQSDRLPTFVLRLPPMGAVPDITYAGECLRVFTCDTQDMVANLTQEESHTVLHKDLSSYYLHYDGSPIDGLSMECGKCYRIKIMSFWSEPFWITDIPQSKITIEFSNSSQLGDVPYQPPVNFVNRIMVDGEICSVDAELFQNKKSENNGNETITFQRLTKRKQLSIYFAPEFIAQLIVSMQIHDTVKVIHNSETLIPLEKRTTVESTKNGCCDYDLTITLPLRDINIIGGNCQSDADGTLTPVEIPEDMPDVCESGDDYLPTDETLCLEFGKVPPPILPPITPVGTPPVGAPCPPNGQVVSSNTVTVDCANAYVFEGVKYKKKITKLIADGSCNTTEQLQYVDPCDNTSTHTVSNILCDTVVIPVPPVGTPPVGTPPVGTPPVGTPPVGTPPVGTPPVGTYPEKFEFIMGTTGGGFDANEPNGIAASWEERIEAFHYSWGWGITGFCLYITWDHYEKTPGVYETAALQRVINYANARQLGLSICFLGRRGENDGFVHDSEMITGSLGKVWIEGVPGFGAVYPSYGCDRTNALIFNAIVSIVNVWKTYSRAFYFAMTGGHSGELVNYVIDNGQSTSQLADFCDDSLARFSTWCTSRGLATPGTVPMIHGPGVGWPHPDFTQARGLEFSRFLSYNIYKYYKNAVNAVKSVSNLPCLYFYASASSLQLRATSNPNMNFIAGPGDGMYGSDGDALYDHIAKIRVNSVNLGTFPNGISAVEFDPDDLSTYRYDHPGNTPPYCGANPQFQVFKTSAETLYQKGTRIIHTAMAFCPSEISNWSQVLQQLSLSYIGKPYVRPTINSTNRVAVEVTEKYRNSEDLVAGIDVNAKYVQYKDDNFWGGVNPPA